MSYANTYLNSGRLVGRADGSGYLECSGEGQGYAGGTGLETGPERTPAGSGSGQALGECHNDSKCLAVPDWEKPKPLLTEKMCAMYGDLVFFMAECSVVPGVIKNEFDAGDFRFTRAEAEAMLAVELMT